MRRSRTVAVGAGDAAGKGGRRGGKDYAGRGARKGNDGGNRKDRGAGRRGAARATWSDDRKANFDARKALFEMMADVEEGSARRRKK